MQSTQLELKSVGSCSCSLLFDSFGCVGGNATARNLFLKYPATATEPEDQFNARYEAETKT